MPYSVPNIVLTIADDQRHDALSAAGHPCVATPALDALAARGTRFTGAHHGGSSHAAVCAPSRAQLHTGRSLWRCTDALTAPLGPGDRTPDPARPLPTLGQRLRDGGYQTMAGGKWHNEPASFDRSFDLGDCVFLGGMGAHFCVIAADKPGPDAALGPGRLRPGHSTDVFTDAALRLLAARDRTRPFFLYVAYTAPHDPRETYARYRLRHDPARVPLPASVWPEHPYDLGRTVRDEMLAEYPRTPDEIRLHRADYHAIVDHLDAGIGRLHAALAAEGLLDNTIVAHTADHGLALGEHGLMGKQSVYDHSTRVPLILAGPGIARGEIDARPCYQHDLHPTLLGFAGIEAEGDFRPLPPFAGDPRQGLLTSYGAHLRAYRQGPHKLIAHRPDAGAAHTHLFDVDADPLETRDLAADPAHAALLGRLAAALRAAMAEAGDPHLARYA